MLRIASGDIIDVDTLLTNSPDGPRARGRARRQDPGVAEGDRRRRFRSGNPGRGPGGHILTGPVLRRGRRARRRARSEDPLDRSADRLRLQRLQRLRAEPTATAGRPARRSFTLDRKTMTAEFLPGIVIPLQAVLRQHGRRAGAGARPRQQQSAGQARRQPRQPRARRRIDALHSGVRRRARCSKSATATPRRATAKSIRRRSRRRCAARLQLTVRKDMKLTWPRAETATDYIAMATDPDLDGRDDDGDPGDGGLPRPTTKGLTKHQAYQLTSIAGNVAITQLVDLPNLGVHVKIAEEHLQEVTPRCRLRLRSSSCCARAARGSRAPHGDGAQHRARASKAAPCAASSRPAWCRRSRSSGSPTRSTPSTARRPARSTPRTSSPVRPRSARRSTTRTSTTAASSTAAARSRGRPIVDLGFLLDDVAVRRKPLDVGARARVADAAHGARDRRRRARGAVALRGFATAAAAPRRAARRRDDAGRRRRPPSTIDGRRYLDASLTEPIPVPTAEADGHTHVARAAHAPGRHARAAVGVRSLLRRRRGCAGCRRRWRERYLDRAGPYAALRATRSTRARARCGRAQVLGDPRAPTCTSASSSAARAVLRDGARRRCERVTECDSRREAIESACAPDSGPA